MPGIDLNFMCHKLSICPNAKPIAQRKRKMGTERKTVVESEVAKLLQARFIREVQYTTWLANVVMVKKPNGKWRMCTDYTNLNKACPKDAYPLPSIDRLVDGAAGHRLLTFLDAYSGYNQIRMHPQDENKTAFITDSTNYCYRVMSFGLKNAGATYQRLMDKIFRHQISKNLEVYVDDMVVKSDDLYTHKSDLVEVFKQLRKHDMRLNPEKCVFGIAGGKFLGFMLSTRGIEANPDKCQSVIGIRSPNSIKEVQVLSGRLTSLSRFLPCLAKVTKLIVRLLKKASKFVWTAECEELFLSLKQRLGTPPILSKLDPGLDMIVYLCVSNEAISAVLVQEKESQKPVYFVSRMLQDAKRRYQLLEKMALGLVHIARRLRQYFHSHRVIVRTDCPIAKVLRKPELAGRMMAWSIELSESDIAFEPRGPIKSQCLVDFVNELQPVGHFESDQWTLRVDDSSNNQGSGAGIILEGPTGLALEQSLRFAFKASNNQAEYEALLAGLRLAWEVGVQKLLCWTDSKVVSEQVNENFQVKDAQLLKYYHTFQNMCQHFEQVVVKHTPRENNDRADQLAKLATSNRKPGQLRTTLHLEISTPSVEAVECLTVVEQPTTWMTDILRLIIEGGELFRRGVSSPLLKCLNSEEANYVLREVHEGICGSHSGGRTLAAKVLRAGYYWPTLKSDCMEFVKKCIQCQKHGNLIHASAEQLHNITSPWPFAMWGMDILGPFPLAKGQCKFLLVAVDYFTKWIEAEPLATITANNVQKFL
uniref:Retrovirus-related Pol polyprotein from transposon 297 family n=1 Tax=Cajanus cajan TaxID=3821 RepID=A0A151U270_CAJCA|nr:Retrovirus-related Pol polyprotein from transposon 297 family [Cajanus cajan]